MLVLWEVNEIMCGYKLKVNCFMASMWEGM